MFDRLTQFIFAAAALSFFIVGLLLTMASQPPPSESKRGAAAKQHACNMLRNLELDIELANFGGQYNDVVFVYETRGYGWHRTSKYGVDWSITSSVSNAFTWQMTATPLTCSWFKNTDAPKSGELLRRELLPIAERGLDLRVTVHTVSIAEHFKSANVGLSFQPFVVGHKNVENRTDTDLNAVLLDNGWRFTDANKRDVRIGRR